MVRHSRVTHTNPDAETSLNLLEAGGLDNDGTAVAERKGVVSRDSRKSCKGEN
jgi:hypothetical protein